MNFGIEKFPIPATHTPIAVSISITILKFPLTKNSKTEWIIMISFIYYFYTMWCISKRRVHVWIWISEKRLCWWVKFWRCTQTSRQASNPQRCYYLFSLNLARQVLLTLSMHLMFGERKRNRQFFDFLIPDIGQQTHRIISLLLLFLQISIDHHMGVWTNCEKFKLLKNVHTLFYILSLSRSRLRLPFLVRCLFCNNVKKMWSTDNVYEKKKHLWCINI